MTDGLGDVWGGAVLLAGQPWAWVALAAFIGVVWWAARRRPR